MSKVLLSFAYNDFAYNYSVMLPFPVVVPVYSHTSYNSYSGYNSSQEITHEPKNISKLHDYAKTGNIKKIVKFSKSKRNEINITNEEGETALHIAAKQKQIKAIKTLIYLGIDTEKKDIHGNLAIDLLATSPAMQKQFSDFVASFYFFKVNKIVMALQETGKQAPQLPYLPKELLNIIAEYSVSSGPYVSTDDNIEQLLLGDNANTQCCVIA